MLFIKDKEGEYRTASTAVVLKEADRACSNSLRRGMFINDSITAKTVLAHRLRGNENEVFCCLFLDASHKILKFKEMFQGTVAKAIVHPREVIKEALACNAAAVILAHNHPSGESEPSQNDINLTKTLKDILTVIDVTVLDHLIIGDDIFSFADRGYLK